MERKSRLTAQDAPGLFRYFVEANRIEEALQHHLPPRAPISIGVDACLRGLWRGRARGQEATKDTPANTGIVES